MANENSEVYLGDGLYASFSRGYVKLRAPREEEDSVVYLEPEVWDALVKYVDTMKQQGAVT